MSIRRRGTPAHGFFRRLDAVARAAFPATSCAVLMVLAASPIGLPSAMAAVALACVFFWSLFRPASMAPPYVFALGLLQDLLSFAPLGVGILTLLLLHGVTLRARRVLARQSFLLVWLAFCGMAAGAVTLGFILQALLGFRLPPVMPALHLLGLTIGFYPALAWVLTRLHRAMQRAEDLA